MTILGTKTFTSNVNKETSYAANSLGTHESTMELHYSRESYFIEWDIPGLERTETIGLWFDAAKALEDYDGVFSLPKEAIELIKSCGFTVDESFV